MSIAEIERWLAPVLNYNRASVDEAAAAEWCGRRRLAHAGMPGVARICGARRKPRQKNRGEKTPVAPRDALCRRWLPHNNYRMPPSAPFGQSRSAREELVFAGFGAGGRRAAVIHILINTANLNDVEGVLSSSPPVRSLHFARQIPHTRKPCGRLPRAQANLRPGRVARRSFTAA